MGPPDGPTRAPSQLCAKKGSPTLTKNSPTLTDMFRDEQAGPPTLADTPQNKNTFPLNTAENDPQAKSGPSMNRPLF